MHRPLLRDVLFYLITTTLVYITFLSGTLTLYHSFAFIIIYLVYVAVVIISGIIHRRNERQRALNNIAQEQNMPGEGVFRRKYQIGGGLQVKTLSKLSLKSLYVPGPGDDFEGVTLRRIKFRKYPLEPSTPCSYNLRQGDSNHVTTHLGTANHFHHRRLTLYHIDGNSGNNWQYSPEDGSNAVCEGATGNGGNNHNNNNIVCTALHYPRSECFPI